MIKTIKAIHDLDPTDMVILLPAGVLAMTEPGERLPDALCDIIRAVAETGYGPLDFGEADDTHTELWFVRCASVVEAWMMAESFIKKGGDV